jgi:acyl-CoA reductase-like NAD-dependent aldehyde dehydrogenase
VAGAALVAHPLVDKVSFTGSVATGQTIQRSAGAQIKRVTLELVYLFTISPAITSESSDFCTSRSLSFFCLQGGNNPMIVFPDADIESTIQTLHDGLFWNEGSAECFVASN